MATGISTAFLMACQPGKYLQVNLTHDGIVIPADEFKIKRKEETRYHSFLIIRNDALQYPICLYRFNDQQYAALWMRCTHQGNELQVSGEYLQCPAHGSEFNNQGKVTNGPADDNLRSFPVIVNQDELFIDLRK
jgi:Rieske Fe-S protein